MLPVSSYNSICHYLLTLQLHAISYNQDHSHAISYNQDPFQTFLLVDFSLGLYLFGCERDIQAAIIIVTNYFMI